MAEDRLLEAYDTGHPISFTPAILAGVLHELGANAILQRSSKFGTGVSALARARTQKGAFNSAAFRVSDCVKGTAGNHRMDIAEARSSPREGERIANLLGLVPPGLMTALDVGARDGFLSVAMTAKVAQVVALDLVEPEVSHPQVSVMAGDATGLSFPEGCFDLVLCAEVLEHIASPALEQVCRELARVSRRFVLIGVPFEQDTRYGRLTCQACGHHNPPWGHVSTFDERRLRTLFADLRVLEISFAGLDRNRTNFISAALNDLACNPWGPYWQEEACIACGARLERPTDRGLVGRVASKTAHVLNVLQRTCMRPRPTWIHVLFEKA